MARKFEMHPDDAQEVAKVRAQLRQMRKELKISGYEMSRRLGRARDFVGGLELGVADSPQVSSLQLLASGVDARIEFSLDGFWLFAHTSRNMMSWYALSRPWGSDREQRMWLVAALREWRVKMGLDVAVTAPLIGVVPDGLRNWEDNSQDPVLARAMLQARATGTVLRMQVWRKADWVFE